MKNTNQTSLTDAEILRKRKLENYLTFRGICANEWTELIILRKKHLLSRGLNPNHYDLGSNYCEKKQQYRENIQVKYPPIPWISKKK